MRDFTPPPSRRELMALAVRLGFGSAVFAAAPALSGARAGVVRERDVGRLTSRSARPVDLETPVEHLDAFLTPSESFFVRSHMLAPAADERTWQLAVDGALRTQTLSVADLRSLPAVSVTATLECAGN